MAKIEKLLKTGKTVFTINELRIIWASQNPNALKASVKYFVDNGKLQRLRKGIYALAEDYDNFELASKIVSPSYISLETALLKHGIIFQFTSAITSLAGYNRSIIINKHKFNYHKMKEEILLNPQGILHEKNYTIASPERAVCDYIYIYGSSYFDNLRSINPDLMRVTVKIYGKKSIEKNIKDLIKNL